MVDQWSPTGYSRVWAQTRGLLRLVRASTTAPCLLVLGVVVRERALTV